MCTYMHEVIQWNPSKPDTIGTDQSVLNIEVSSFQGLLRQMSTEKVSCLWRCPQFRGPYRGVPLYIHHTWQNLSLVYGVFRLELLRAERENAMFPDEVDTPQDVPARVRFQKYVVYII